MLLMMMKSFLISNSNIIRCLTDKIANVSSNINNYNNSTSKNRNIVIKIECKTNSYI